MPKRQLGWSQRELLVEGLHRRGSPRSRPGTKASDAVDWGKVCSYGKLVWEWVTEDRPGDEPNRVQLQVESHAQPDLRGVLKCELHLRTPTPISHCYGMEGEGQLLP